MTDGPLIGARAALLKQSADDFRAAIAAKKEADMTTEPTEDAWEDRCTDCDDTGITIQTERRCACQPPLDDYTRTPPVSMDEVEAVARAIRIRALETADMDESEQWFAEQFARAALAALSVQSDKGEG